MYLVLIETSGNQNFIFSTNKLKENIGASELTYRAGTEWVLQAVKEIGSYDLWDLDRYCLRNNLLNPHRNRPIASNNPIQVEVIVATSGKALLLTHDELTARQIIRTVTQRALKEAPGMDFCGVFEEFDWNTDSIGCAIRKIHQSFEAVRTRKPAPQLRFLQIPVIAQCSTSGLPAAQTDSADQKPISEVSLKKRLKNEPAFERLSRLLQDDRRSFVRNVRELEETFEKNLEWLAVIHADGNGLGEIFLNFDRVIDSDASLSDKAEFNRAYVDQLRQFSIHLDICTEQAFIDALQTFGSDTNKPLPVIPLILGGDDITIICDGKSALDFTHQFLDHFEQETQKDSILSNIACRALSINRLSACAGVAIIKPHFPFSIAYQLAEALTKSAKQIKEIVKTPAQKPHPCSALDFHIVFDASGVELKQIRQKLELTDGTNKIKLYGRPYVTTKVETLEAESASGIDWIKLHQWQDLEKKVRAIIATDEEGRRRLPNSQLHDLRSALFLGKASADARYKLIRGRYQDQGIAALDGQLESLFSTEPAAALHTYITGLLDAIDAAEFLSP